jgi:transmembrane sensor
MEHVLSVEELILNDSFINYCYFKNPEDTSYWEKYISQNPAEKNKVDEARLFVLALRNVVDTTEQEVQLEKFKRSGFDNVSAKRELNVVYMASDAVRTKRRKYAWFAAASVIALISASIWIIAGPEVNGENVRSKGIANQMLVENAFARTGVNERKIVYLVDGTKVTMNANTTLTVDSSFGMNTRLVRLEGEAFFDVQHDTRAPFIVQLKDFRIRVLGTMFNVRSYPGDRNSETSLVKGKVEIEENITHHRLFLKPYEKAILPSTGFTTKTLTEKNGESDRIKPSPIVVKSLTISNDGVSISETAWMQNRLEINDETFLELKSKLERWYRISIRFNDEEVKQYRFTATFEKENIDQALQAMQLSYPFKYTKKENLIMIEK